MAELGPTKFYELTELERHLGRMKMHWFVRESEAEFLRMAHDVADRAAWNPEIKAIFVSGPTSSGKTTFADRLAGALHMLGRPTTTMHLDDYYRQDTVRRDAKGRPDYESEDTLEMAMIIEHIQTMIRGGRIIPPTYDFVTRGRSYEEARAQQLAPRGLLIVEGLHGLSGTIASEIPEHQCLKVFIMPHATMASDHKLLDARDIRIMRRVSRDVHHRGSSPLATLDYWPMLDVSEQACFPSYLARADVFVNSAMPYEFFVIAPMSGKLIKAALDDLFKGCIEPSPYLPEGTLYADLPETVKLAKRLVKASEEIPCISPDIVPEISILNEFIH